MGTGYRKEEKERKKKHGLPKVNSKTNSRAVNSVERTFPGEKDTNSTV